jgi:3'(2'), 5'-bisphosphate nucleotidase
MIGSTCNTSQNLPELLNQIIILAQKAGEKTLEYYYQDYKVDYKSDNSPLTLADLAANAIIVAGLEDIAPDIPIISEESGIASYTKRKKWQKFWLVDPLDGTKEFIKKNGEFTINIALIENRQPILGVIYLPVKKWLYFASLQTGSRKRIGNDDILLQSRKVKLNEPLRVAESRSHTSEELELFLSKLNVRERLQVGSSLKFCYVAEGKVDIYPRLSPTMEWDVAAGDAIFRFSGKDRILETGLTYNKPELRNEGFVIINTEDDLNRIIAKKSM